MTLYNLRNDTKINKNKIQSNFESLEVIASGVIGVAEQVDNYTLALTDVYKIIEMNKGTAVTLTVPKNSVVAFAIGVQVKGYQKGAGKVTIAPVDGDVTIRSAGSADETFEQYSTFMLTKIATNTWLLEGDIA
jgi:hypothetical protein